MPATRATFWLEKLTLNRERDRQVCSELLESGWRVGIVWECALRGSSTSEEPVAGVVAKWLRGTVSELEIPAMR